jgi:hypothetical protein
MTGPAGTARHGRLRRVREAIRLPRPVEDPLFPSRAQAASYLGAWGLTVTHLLLWLLITIGLFTSEALVIGVSLLSAAATCLFVVMVIAAHRRLQIYRGSTARHIAAVWWRGPWDPVGRLIWLPVRLPAAWHALRHRTSPPPQRGPGRDGTGDPGRGAFRQAGPPDLPRAGDPGRHPPVVGVSAHPLEEGDNTKRASVYEIKIRGVASDLVRAEFDDVELWDGWTVREVRGTSGRAWRGSATPIHLPVLAVGIGDGHA